MTSRSEATPAAWRPIETAPRCVDGVTDGTNGRRPVIVTRYPFTGHHAPMAVARLTTAGWINGRRGNRLWFEPTHWTSLPNPPKEESNGSSPINPLVLKGVGIP